MIFSGDAHGYSIDKTVGNTRVDDLRSSKSVIRPESNKIATVITTRT